MFSKKGFSLTEILIGVVLMALIILAVVSVDITSRRFFATASSESWIQDEAKIAMGHIIKNVQLGIGDMTNAGAIGSLPGNSSRGFYILDGGNLAISGSKIQIKQDKNGDGRYVAAVDKIVQYNYNSGNRTIEYTDGGTENLADGIVESAIFSFSTTTPNQVLVTITVRKVPGLAASLDNPETTLTSDIILRAMSTN